MRSGLFGIAQAGSLDRKFGTAGTRNHGHIIRIESFSP